MLIAAILVDLFMFFAFGICATLKYLSMVNNFRFQHQGIEIFVTVVYTIFPVLLGIITGQIIIHL